jgi:hypothetical protein
MGKIDGIVEAIRPYLAPDGAFSRYSGTTGDLVEALAGLLGTAQDEDCKLSGYVSC